MCQRIVALRLLLYNYAVSSKFGLLQVCMSVSVVLANYAVGASLLVPTSVSMLSLCCLERVNV